MSPEEIAARIASIGKELTTHALTRNEATHRALKAMTDFDRYSRLESKTEHRMERLTRERERLIAPLEN